MFAIIHNLLNANDLTAVNTILSTSKFVDGRLSAGQSAINSKHNLELSASNEIINNLNSIVMNRLVQHPDYRAICWPKKLAAPIYSRYEPSMFYGVHTDDPVMGDNELYRSDISMTIFLSSPEDYLGGELTIIETGGERPFKLAAGAVLFYPSSSQHYVAPVSEGIRQVAITWLQSSIRDPEKRKILFDLYRSRETLLKECPKSKACEGVSASFNNLVRMWVEI
ncbi:MAG: PKHD-type hydroxylase [Gammaproteobacteria bacterium]|jgi:PKHD-type hydroxylase